MFGKVSSPTGSRAVKVASKQVRALELRAQRLNFNQIAEALAKEYKEPCSYSNARRLVVRALEDTVSEACDDLRAIEGMVLDGLYLETNQRMQLIDKKDVKTFLKAIETLLKISEARIKLFGLDRPQKVALTTPDGESEYKGGMSPHEELAMLLAEAKEIERSGECPVPDDEDDEDSTD